MPYLEFLAFYSQRWSRRNGERTTSMASCAGVEHAVIESVGAGVW